MAARTRSKAKKAGAKRSPAKRTKRNPSGKPARPARKVVKSVAKKAARKATGKPAKKSAKKAAKKAARKPAKKAAAKVAKKAKKAARKVARSAAKAVRKAAKAPRKAARKVTKKAVARKRPSRPAAKAAKPKKKAASAAARRRQAALVAGPPPSKTYMSQKQREWFRHKLQDMLEEIQHEAEKTAQGLREQEKIHADEFDRANSEFAFVVDLKENERIGNLQVKINQSLRQIEESTYGFCDDCGVEIGIDRMVARPVATKCIDCKEFQENQEKHAI